MGEALWDLLLKMVADAQRLWIGDQEAHRAVTLLAKMLQDRGISDMDKLRVFAAELSRGAVLETRAADRPSGDVIEKGGQA